MYYIILLAILILFAYFSFILFNKDILSPSFIVCCAYAISDIFAFIAKVKNSWNNIELGLQIVCIITVGVGSFILGELLIRKIIKTYKTKYNNDSKEENKKIDLFNIETYKIIIVYFFLIITFVIIYIQMSQITGIKKDVSAMINTYRNLTPIFNKTSSNISISTLAMQLYRASNIFGFTFLYIIIHNLVLKDKLKNNIKYMGIIIIDLIISFFISGRSVSVSFIIGAIVIWILLNRKFYYENKILKKAILIFFTITIITIPLFYGIMPLLGRKQSTNFLEYISFYLGCPIPSFQELYNRKELNHSDHFGEETFTGIQRILDKFGIIDYYAPLENQWINFGSLSSNVFTGLKEYYVDFGALGVIVFQMIGASLITTMYIWASKRSNIFYIIFYTFFFMSLLDQYRSERIFNSVISIDTVIYAIYLYVIIQFLFYIKIKKRRIVYER